MRKKSWLLWVVLALMAFVVMSGGCSGGGGGGNGDSGTGSGTDDGGGSQEEEAVPPSTESVINPEFIKWQESIEEGEPVDYGYGVAPDPIDWSHLGNANYILSGARGAEQLPSAYDGRNNGVVTSVKNQMPHLLCWAFGTIASLESTTLKAGISNNPDFSERHLGYFTYHSDDNHVAFTNINGWDYPGGSFGRATATLTRGTGPVREEDSPYSPDNRTVMPPPDSKAYTNALTVTDVYNLSIAQLEVGDNTLTKREKTYTAMKELLISEGVIGVSYFDDGEYYNTTETAYYNDSNIPGSNHIVAIVGWDDNYSAGNFKTTPPGNGAWLIKNSWDTSHGDGGYQWISYYDTTLGGVALYKGEKADKYQTMYLYDPLGYTSSTGYGTSDMYAANVFTASGNEQIEAVAFNTVGALTAYEVRIYRNLTNLNNPSSGTLQTQAISRGQLTYAGYHTVRLAAPVPLTAGESFAVVIKISAQSPDYANFALEAARQYYSEAATASAGQSFTTNAKEPGAATKWFDLKTYEANACIRALTNPISLVAPTIETESLPGGTVETAYSQTLSASGTAPITWTIASGVLPAGLSLNPTTGEISGTPTAADTFNFTVMATNSAGSATKDLGIVISSVTVPPAIDTVSLQGGTVGTAYSQTLSASGTAPITWTVASGALPNGLSLDNATGEISGTPTAASTFSFTVRAANAAGSTTKALSVVIAAVSTSGNWIDVADTSWYDNAPNSANYTVRTAQELAGVAKLLRDNRTSFSGKTLTLAANIDLAGREWTPMGWNSETNVRGTTIFAGTFDGGGKIISNMKITSHAPGALSAGLFGLLLHNSEVRNVNMANVNIDLTASVVSATALGGWFGVGAIVGHIQNGIVSGCSSSGSITATSSTMHAVGGGIAGSNHTATVSNCTSSVNVATSSSGSNISPVAGGIVGHLSYSTVSGCISTGNVSSNGSSSCVGGIVGWVDDNQGSVSIVNCHKPSGRVSGNGTAGTAGGVVGLARYIVSGSLSGNDFSKSATGQTYGIGSDGRNNNQPSNDGAAPLP